MEQLKLLSMTGVVTVLIWAAADSLVHDTITVGVEFHVVPAIGSHNMVVNPVDKLQPFYVQLAGPRRMVEQAQAASPLSVRLQVPDQPTGEAYIPLKNAMDEQWREFSELTVVSVNPPRFPVYVDHSLTRELQLELKEDLGLQYDVKPQLDRSIVSVEMLQSHFNEYEALGKPLRIAVDPEQLLEDQPPGQAVEVPLTLVPSDWGFPEEATFTPSAITVSATVKADRVTREIGTVPILLAVSFANFGRSLRAVPPDGGILVTRTITVTGPAHQVERMSMGERPIGIIRLKEEHLEMAGTQLTFVPEFQLPPGVELAKDPEPVVLTLVAGRDSPAVD